MARLLHAGRLVAPVCLALAGCLPAIPTGSGSDTGSLFDVGLADLGVDFDTGGSVTPPDGSDDTDAGSGSGQPDLPTPTLVEIAQTVLVPACGDCHISQTLGSLWLEPNAALRDRLLAGSLQASMPPTSGARSKAATSKRAASASRCHSPAVRSPSSRSTCCAAGLRVARRPEQRAQ